MFDLIAGSPRHPFHDSTIAPTIVSVISHGMVLLALAGASFLAAGELPEVPDMMAFVAAAPAPPPPPPPPPAARRATPAKPRALPVASPSATPVEAPSAIVAETIVPWDESLAGVEGGVEGGVVGGVLGGVVRGFVGALPLPPPPPPEPMHRVPMRIGGQITAPALVHRVEPSYPEIAVHAKLTGTVILEATVDITGTVESVRVLRSVSLLDKAAIEAVKQWRYSPLVLNGVPSPFILTVTLNFSMKHPRS